MKRTRCGRWVHSTCELWIPETQLDADSGLVEGLQRIPKVPPLPGCHALPANGG
jgi:hypothetical protein